MTIMIVILLTASLIFIGKGSTRMGLKEYLIIFFVTLTQVAFFIFTFLTMEPPPGF